MYSAGYAYLLITLMNWILDMLAYLLSLWIGLWYAHLFVILVGGLGICALTYYTYGLDLGHAYLRIIINDGV